MMLQLEISALLIAVHLNGAALTMSATLTKSKADPYMENKCSYVLSQLFFM